MQTKASSVRREMKFPIKQKCCSHMRNMQTQKHQIRDNSKQFLLLIFIPPWFFVLFKLYIESIVEEIETIPPLKQWNVIKFFLCYRIQSLLFHPRLKFVTHSTPESVFIDPDLKYRFAFDWKIQQSLFSSPQNFVTGLLIVNPKSGLKNLVKLNREWIWSGRRK